MKKQSFKQFVRYCNPTISSKDIDLAYEAMVKWEKKINPKGLEAKK